MERIRGVRSLKRAYPSTVIVIGNFDGVHLGHQALLSRAVESAKKSSGTAVAYTFSPHPQAALRPERAPPRLTTDDERAEAIALAGIDLLIEEPFDRAFSATTAETFFLDYLKGPLSPIEIVVGYDFGFGRARSGGLEELSRLCEAAGVRLTVVLPQQSEGGEVASSSRIREHLLAGRVSDAARLLGREFTYRGVVEHGEKRGSRIGFPTANLRLPTGKLVLPSGVYAVRASFGSPGDAESRAIAVANLGTRPTFYPNGELCLETHLLDQATPPDLYGCELKVSFVARLRDEKRFASVVELTEQIRQDCESARAALK